MAQQLVLADILSHLRVAVMTLTAVRAVDGVPGPCSRCAGSPLRKPADALGVPRPDAIVAWPHARAARIWARKSHGDQHSGRVARTGRPRTRPEIEDLVRMVKSHDPAYDGERIARILVIQFGCRIHPDTVRAIRRRRPLTNPGSTTPQSYWTFPRNHTHCMASMDFKVVKDWLGRQVFILNILHHGRHRLLRSYATLNFPRRPG